MTEAVLVLDVGKTHAKLTLVAPDGAAIAVRTRANEVRVVDGRRVLDADGIESWMLATARELTSLAQVGAIVPVGHGATAALVHGDRLIGPVLDYEQAVPPHVVEAYDAERDPFGETFSPRLPVGLNLGQQLFWQERLYPEAWPKHAQALLWPQYWAWRLCGETSAEVSSLGCHTDLWRPFAGGYSALATRRGWADRLGSLRQASDVLGVVRPELARAIGLPADCAVLCGLHDSNASLHAVRGAAALAGKPFSLVSTGTWFVAFQVGGQGARSLDPARDTLVNVAIDGTPVPSARFMGGREYEAIVAGAFGARGTVSDLEHILRRGVMTTPSFATGSGPFPHGEGRVIGQTESPEERAALASLHLALMTDASLSLVGAEGPIVIDGRFAEDPLYPAVLAALRPGSPVLLCQSGDGVALGAARLWRTNMGVGPALAPARPLAYDLGAYAARWRAAVEAG